MYERNVVKRIRNRVLFTKIDWCMVSLSKITIYILIITGRDYKKEKSTGADLPQLLFSNCELQSHGK